jgi:hypothetical protein
MGTNSSVFLHPEHPADDETVIAFQEFENECISRNLKANQIYDILNEKYDHFLDKEMEKQRSELNFTAAAASSANSPLFPSQTTEISTQRSKIYKKNRKTLPTKATKSSVLRSMGTASPARKLLPPLKNTKNRSESPCPQPRSSSVSKTQNIIGKTFGSLSKTKLPPLKSMSCDAADSYSHSRAIVLTPPGILEVQRSSSSDSMTITERFDEFQTLSLTEIDHLTDDETDKCPGNPFQQDTTAAPAEENSHRITFANLVSLCQEANRRATGRRFSLTIENDLPSLNSHFECRLCKKKFGSSELLETHIAFSQTHKESVHRVRGKYARALQHADRDGHLLRKATERFQRVLHMKKQFLEGKITLAKMRWHQAVSKIMSQFAAKQIEKIMQELQDEEEYEKSAVAAADDAAAPQPGVLMFTSNRFFWRTKSRFNIYVLYHKHCHTLEVLSVLIPEKHEEHVAKLGPRLFLSMGILEGQFDLWHDPNSTLLTDASTLPATSVVTAAATGGVISAEDTSITRAMRIVRDVVQSLKQDFASVQQGTKTREEALYFDDSMSVVRQLSSPLLTEQPEKLILTNAESYLRLDADDAMVQAKMDELSQAQKLLSEAVYTAEKISKRVNTHNSPRHRPLLLSPIAMAKAMFSPKRFGAKFAF